MSDVTPDGGPVDGGPVDDEPPTVIGTDPVDEAEDVMPRPVRVFFSEEMDDAVGTATVTADGAALDATPTWSVEGTDLVLEADLPVDATIEVTLDGYADLAGNALATYVFSFETADITAPYVVTSTPEEGSTSIAPELTEVSFELSETLASDSGTVTLVGGPGSVDSWTLGEASLLLQISGLAPETAYEVVLTGFADGSGNPLDTERYLGDGALDFTTGIDSTAPMVVSATPAEGAVDVTIGLNSITVTFSEPMDPSVGSGVLVGGVDSRTLTPSWSDGDAVARFVLSDLLLVDTDYALTLVGFVDQYGNALDRTTYLVDGAVDFTTGDDIFAPYVVGSSPAEGATNVPYATDFVQVAFSEVMDTSIDTVQIVSSRGTVDVTGTWLPSGTSIVFPVEDIVIAGQSYAIDFSGFIDTNGTALDAAHFYLGDGVLGFTTVAPGGERCRDELSTTEATEISPGVFQWNLADDAVEFIDGTMTCDTSTSPDAVIRVTKAEDDTVLRVQGASSSDMVLQVMQGLCDSRDPDADSARRRCIDNSTETGANIEGPAGDYYIWVARALDLSFEPTSVSVEEIAVAPDGETCSAPLVIGSTRYYTAPASAGEFHEWTVPMDGVYGYDRGVQEDDAFDFPCASGFTSRGADAVIRVDKTTASSILELEVEANGATYEILEGACDPTAATASRVCAEDASSTELSTIIGDPRSFYVWAAGTEEGVFDGSITVRAREVEPGPGESCLTGIPIVEGSNTISPSSTLGIDSPSCMGSQITWYRFTASTSLATITADGFAPAAVVDAAAATEQVCVADPTTGFASFLTTGRDYCVGITTGSGTTSLTVDSVDYPGVTGNTVTDLMITPFDTGSTFDNAFDPEDWLVVTPTYIYLASDGDRLIRAPRAGGVEATSLWEGEFSTMGHAGVAIGEAVFGVDDSTSAANRLYRYVDDTGTAAVTPWDDGSTWVNDAIDALAYDGTSLIMASEGEGGDPTIFYSADPTTPGPVTQIGSNNILQDVSAIAVDPEWIYIVGQTVGSTSLEAVYRLRRSDLGDPMVAPEELSVGGLTLNHSDDTAGLQLQPASGGAPAVLYFRTYGDHTVYAILSPEAPSPSFLGAINTTGRNNDDYVLGIDPTIPALFITEEETDISNPRFLRLE